MKLLICFVFLPILSLAATMEKNPSQEKCGFEMMIPGSWSVTGMDHLKSPNCFEMTSKKEASLLVLSSSESKASCVDFLKAMDDSRKKKNSLPVEKQKMSETLARKAMADEGALGEYEISEPKMKVAVKQKAFCFKKGDQTRVLLATYQKSKGAQYEPLLLEIVPTFKFSVNERSR